MMYSNTFSYIAHVHESGQNKHKTSVHIWWMGLTVLLFFPFYFLPLVIEFKVEIRRVELMQTNVTIFTTASVRLAIGMESQGVDRTEMTLDTTKFFFKN